MILSSDRLYTELCLWTRIMTASAPVEIAVPRLLWSSVPPEVKITACEGLECCQCGKVKIINCEHSERCRYSKVQTAASHLF